MVRNMKCILCYLTAGVLFVMTATGCCPSKGATAEQIRSRCADISRRLYPGQDEKSLIDASTFRIGCMLSHVKGAEE